MKLPFTSKAPHLAVVPATQCSRWRSCLCGLNRLSHIGHDNTFYMFFGLAPCLFQSLSCQKRKIPRVKNDTLPIKTRPIIVHEEGYAGLLTGTVTKAPRHMTNAQDDAGHQPWSVLWQLFCHQTINGHLGYFLSQ